MGQARYITPPTNEVITPSKWYRMGIDKLKHKDKYLGIRLGTPEDIKESWTRLLGKVETECVQAMARSDPGATKGRLMWTRGVFAAKCWYLFKLQSPSPTDRKVLLDRLQTVCDMGTMGTHTNFVRAQTDDRYTNTGGWRLRPHRCTCPPTWRSHSANDIFPQQPSSPASMAKLLDVSTKIYIRALI